MKTFMARLILASLAVVLLAEGAEVVFAVETGQQLAYVSTGGTVGEYPMVISPDGSRLYVTGNAPVTVLDISTNSVLSTIEIPDCNTESTCLSVVNTNNHNVEVLIPVGSRPLGMAITPDGTRVYVADWYNFVYVIDTTTNTLLTIIEDVAANPRQVAISPDGTRAYVTDWNATVVTVIDVVTNEVIDRIIWDMSTGLAITPDGTRIYVTGGFTNLIAVIDTASNTIVDTIEVEGAQDTRGIAITPDGTRAYATTNISEHGEGPVAVIDTATNEVAEQISHIGGIGSPFISPDGMRLYVITGGNSLWVFDTNTNTKIAEIDVPAWGVIAFAPFCPVEAMIEALIQHVQTIDLKNIGGFTAKLDAAKNSYSKAVANDYVSTINQLETFKNKCDADSYLSAAERSALKSEADVIINCVRSKI